MICPQCHQRLLSCPQCRQAYKSPPIRNRILESIISKLKPKGELQEESQQHRKNVFHHQNLSQHGAVGPPLQYLVPPPRVYVHQPPPTTARVGPPPPTTARVGPPPPSTARVAPVSPQPPPRPFVGPPPPSTARVAPLVPQL